MSGVDFAALAEAPSARTVEFNARLKAKLDAFPAQNAVPVEQTRAARDAGKGVFPLGGPLAEVADLAIGAAPGGPGRARLAAPDAEPRGLHVHVHGGGWVFGRPWHYDRWNLDLARAAGVAVVSVEYRLAPEHRWPACAEDVAAALFWALDEGRARFGAERVTIGGESAGAHLAAVALMRAKAAGRLGEVAGAILTYGAFDLSMTPSMAGWGSEPFILSTPVVDWFVDHLLGPAGPARDDPAVSPLYADMSGLPPCLLQCGTVDPLLDDSLLMAARLASAGVRADLRIVPGGVHAFDMFDIPIAREAKAAEAAFLCGLAD